MTRDRRLAVSRALDAEGLRSGVTVHRHVTADEFLVGLETEGWTVRRLARRWPSRWTVAALALLVAGLALLVAEAWR